MADIGYVLTSDIDGRATWTRMDNNIGSVECVVLDGPNRHTGQLITRIDAFTFNPIRYIK